MREGWEFKTLEDTCNIDYGTRVVQKKDKGSTYYVYGGGGATFMVDRYNRENCFIVSRFAMSPKCTRFVEGRFFLNDSGLSVSTKNDNLSQRFLDKVLLANNDIIYSMGKGLAQRNLDMSSFKKLQIPIPPLPEQERIVSELDLLSSIIEKKKSQLEEYDKLAQSIFYDMFGDLYNTKYPIKTLQEICEFIKDGTHQTPTYTEDKKNGFKFLSAKDVVEGYINWNNIKYIPKELHEELYKRIAPQRNDLLLCKNGTTGICAIVETDEIFDIYVSLALLRPNKPFCPNYLLYAINNPYTKQQFDESLKGVGVPNLHLGEIKKAKIISPPLPLQQQFASKIEAIEKQKELIRQSITEVETLFNSRMDYYFN